MSESLWRRLKQLWRDPQVAEKPHSMPGRRSQFTLCYQNRTIGTLVLQNGVWTFSYSDDFKTNNNPKLRTITEFPDVDRTYQSHELWPFFQMRIPSLRQSSIKKIVANEHIDENDEAKLLERFGRRTVANPFELVPSP